eukprot:578668-Pelagomonas_calceolata.AAC.1
MQHYVPVHLAKPRRMIIANNEPAHLSKSAPCKIAKDDFYERCTSAPCQNGERDAPHCFSWSAKDKTARLLQSVAADGQAPRKVSIETEPWFNMESAWVQGLGDIYGEAAGDKGGVRLASTCACAGSWPWCSSYAAYTWHVQLFPLSCFTALHPVAGAR